MATILIVEDDNDFRAVMRDALSGVGHDVTEARDAAEALEKIAGRAYDLVITDILMSQVDGLSLIREIETVAPKTPVIAISGGDAAIPPAVSLTATKAMGVSHRLAKPFRLKELLSTVDEVLG